MKSKEIRDLMIEARFNISDVGPALLADANTLIRARNASNDDAKRSCYMEQCQKYDSALKQYRDWCTKNDKKQLPYTETEVRNFLCSQGENIRRLLTTGPNTSIPRGTLLWNQRAISNRRDAQAKANIIEFFTRSMQAIKKVEHVRTMWNNMDHSNPLYATVEAFSTCIAVNRLAEMLVEPTLAMKDIHVLHEVILDHLNGVVIPDLDMEVVRNAQNFEVSFLRALKKVKEAELAPEPAPDAPTGP